MKSVEVVFLALLLIIIFLLLFLIVSLNFGTSNIKVKYRPNELYNKVNAFTQDLCAQMKMDHYTVIFDKKRRIEGKNIYITSTDEKEAYREIIELLANGNDNKKMMEQIAYNLGYLVCTINCSEKV